jgi:hypothetical protein
MYVTVNYSATSSKEAMRFINRFKDVQVEDVCIKPKYSPYGTKRWEVEVRVCAEDVEEIECGEHRPGTNPYPKDLLITTHKHE